MQNTFKRQTAYRINIKQILNAEYIKKPGWDPNVIKDDFGREISRVNIVGVVLSKSEDLNYKSITIDDGSGIISVRSFGDENLFSNIEIGDVVCVIGRPREYSNQKYVVAEIVKRVRSKKFLELRKLEIELEQKMLSKKKEKEPVKADIIYNLIKELDEGDGVSIQEIMKKTSGIDDVEKIVKKMLENGDIYEIRKGRFKTL
ncbi:hypothetical protein DRN75_04010 [Nanoarchaeota archaeon]|nr:MAG: hypothetical protein DRN75_04010 [Nanoarchaeota archaeon]